MPAVGKFARVFGVRRGFWGVRGKEGVGGRGHVLPPTPPLKGKVKD